MKGLPEIVSPLGSCSKAGSGVIRFSRDGGKLHLRSLLETPRKPAAGHWGPTERARTVLPPFAWSDTLMDHISYPRGGNLEECPMELR